MIGPVLDQELRLGGRRRRLHLLRWVFGGLMLAQVVYVYLLVWPSTSTASRRFFGFTSGDWMLASLSLGHVHVLAWEQMLLVVLLTPGFVAGQVTDEKARGTLEHLLTTDLRSWEIVVGKVLAQWLLLGTLLALTVPALLFGAVTAGMAPDAVLAHTGAMFLLVLLVGAASVLASVRARTTTEAMLAVYGGGAVLLLAAWGVQSLAPSLGTWGAAAGDVAGQALAVFHPYYLLEGAWDGSAEAELWSRLLTLGLTWGGLAAVCLAVASWRLRPGFARQLQALGRGRRGQATPRPAVTDDPVLWKEEHVEGIAPLGLLARIPRSVALAAVAVATFVCLVALYPRPAVSSASARAGFHAVVGLLTLGLVGLLAAVRASSAVSRERERQTWEALMMTPLVTREVIRGKFWGIVRMVLCYLGAVGAPAVVVTAFFEALTLRQTAPGVLPRNSTVPTLVHTGVTFVWAASAAPFALTVVSIGLLHSAAGKSSWRSLLKTLVTGFPIPLPLAMIVPGMLTPLVEVTDSDFLVVIFVWGLIGCLALAGLGWLAVAAVRTNLRAAEDTILKAERTWIFPEGLLDDPEGLRRWLRHREGWTFR